MAAPEGSFALAGVLWSSWICLEGFRERLGAVSKAFGDLLGTDWEVQGAWKRSCRSMLLLMSCIFENFEEALIFNYYRR